MRKTPVLGLLLASLAATGVPAEESRIPVFQPATLTQSGHYLFAGHSPGRELHLLDGNVIEGGASFGIQFTGSGDAYRNNMLRNNAAGPVNGTATDAGGNIIDNSAALAEA